MITVSFVIDESSAEGFSIKTDKQIYDQNDDVVIITISDGKEGQMPVALHNENGNLMSIIMLHGNMTGYATTELRLSDMRHTTDSNGFKIWINGTYTLKSNISSNYQQVVFNIGDIDLIKNNINYPTGVNNSDEFIINTDKAEYYIDNFIIVNGSIGTIDWNDNTTIKYVIKRADKIIETGNISSLQNDGKFQFMMDTSTWNSGDIGGVYQLDVTIQDSTATMGIFYYNTPDMSPETLYQISTDQQNTLNVLDQDVKNLRTDTNALRNDTDTLRTDVDSLQIQFNNFQIFVNEQLQIIFQLFNNTGN